MTGAGGFDDDAPEAAQDFLPYVRTRLRAADWDLAATESHESGYLLFARSAEGGRAVVSVVPGADTTTNADHLRSLVSLAMDNDAATVAVASRGSFTETARSQARRRGVALLGPEDLAAGAPLAARASGHGDEDSAATAESSTPDAETTTRATGPPSDGDTATAAEESTSTDGNPASAASGPRPDAEPGVDPDLDNAMKYPLNERGWWKTIAIGTVVEYLTFLVVPLFVLQGYYVRVMRRTMAGDAEPPGFGRPGALVVDGLKASLIAAGYYGIPLAISLVVLFVALGSLSEGSAGGALGTLLVGVFVALVVFWLVTYVAGAGFVRFAATDRVTAAFSPSLLRLVLSGRWFVMYLKLGAISLAVAVLATVLSGALSFIPVLGWIAAGIVAPAKVKYLGTVNARLVAKTYRDLASLPDESAAGDANASPSPDETEGSSAGRMGTFAAGLLGGLLAIVLGLGVQFLLGFVFAVGGLIPPVLALLMQVFAGAIAGVLRGAGGRAGAGSGAIAGLLGTLPGVVSLLLGLLSLLQFAGSPVGPPTGAIVAFVGGALLVLAAYPVLGTVGGWIGGALAGEAA